jgi:hypothetical protein
MAHRVLRTAHLACDVLDPQPRSLQPQHLRHVLRRLHYLPPRRVDNRQSLHDCFHLECPSEFGGQFLVSFGGQFTVSPDRQARNSWRAAGGLKLPQRANF